MFVYWCIPHQGYRMLVNIPLMIPSISSKHTFVSLAHYRCLYDDKLSVQQLPVEVRITSYGKYSQ